MTIPKHIRDSLIERFKRVYKDHHILNKRPPISDALLPAERKLSQCFRRWLRVIGNTRVYLQYNSAPFVPLTDIANVALHYYFEFGGDIVCKGLGLSFETFCYMYICLMEDTAFQHELRYLKYGRTD